MFARFLPPVVFSLVCAGCWQSSHGRAGLLESAEQGITNTIPVVKEFCSAFPMNDITIASSGMGLGAEPLLNPSPRS